MSLGVQVAGRRALLIGIDQYPNIPPQYQLHGCVNDVQLLHGILRDRFGFPEQNIVVLTNAQATQQGIRAAVEALIAATQPDDVVVIQYSGHGSQAPDGPEADEPNGMDSTIVPCDSGRGTLPNRDITDDEVHQWLSRLTQRTSNVTLILDCCHSGTISRDAFGDAARWLEPETRSRAEIAATLLAPSLSAAEASQLQAARRDLGVGGSGWLPLGENYLLIAGCRDDESAHEYTPRASAGAVTQGALTYFLGQQLSTAMPGTTYRDIFERVAALVGAYRIDQHPQMEGTRDRLLFDTSDVVPPQFVPVTQVAGDVLTLGAGAAHGVTVGSQWAIYPQGTKQVTGEAPPLALVQITAVRVVESDAALIPSPPPTAGTTPAAGVATQAPSAPTAPAAASGAAQQVMAPTVGGRAVEVTHAYGEMRLVVDVAAPAGYEDAVAALRQALARSQLARERAAGESADAADMRVYVIPPRTQVGAGDPVPQLGPAATATWALVGRDGQLASPAHALSEPGVTDLLCQNLEKLARYRNALALRNPDPASALRGAIDFTLLRQADGAWQEATPDPASGQIVYEAGDAIAFTITNRHGAPVYISALDFGLTGRIGLIYPPGKPSEPFTVGTPVQIWQRPGERVPLGMPPDFTGDEGIETFKLFVTTQPADFSWIAQEGTRAFPPTDSPLAQLFALAYAGSDTRDVVQAAQLPPLADWTTVERSFVLRRGNAPASL